jgi:hypothetical protein
MNQIGLNNKVGILPSCWGPAMWFAIHSIAYAYNPQTDKENYNNFFSNLGSILPCEECRIHYSQNVSKQELLMALNSPENLFRWVYDLHNKVNRQTGVPESKWPSYESIKERYSSFKASCADIPGVCGSSQGLKKKMKMVEQFGDLNEDQLPFLIATVILAVLLICAISYIICLKRKR